MHTREPKIHPCLDPNIKLSSLNVRPGTPVCCNFSFEKALYIMEPDIPKKVSLCPWPERLNDPSKGLWCIYHIGIIIGYGIRPKFYGSFGPEGVWASRDLGPCAECDLYRMVL